MPNITTARILTDKVLEETCGQECVDWAISMLEQDCDGHYLAILAGMSPPFNHFEIADLRDHSLREMGLSDFNESTAITTYVAEQLRILLNGADLAAKLDVIKDICIALDYQKDIYDFYLLYFAYTDLQESDFQWYWEGATRENIVSIVHERAEAFLHATDNA